ncbi:hypothetical protein [Companilactobacillus sp.]|uniref:hypothetical protein n=1 Tax=Companilactobacillus sp. TaxID=2767905 RepID=UPI0026227DD2|nr:hypothetical protein [Companilactobacillus sp.]
MIQLHAITKKGDTRWVDGVEWVCTDPEINRWVSNRYDPNDPPSALSYEERRANVPIDFPTVSTVQSQTKLKD